MIGETDRGAKVIRVAAARSESALEIIPAQTITGERAVQRVNGQGDGRRC